MNGREWAYLICSLLMLTFCNIGFAMFAAFFPPYMATLHIEQSFIAPIFSSFTVANVIGSVISAPLATRLGRQPVLLGGAVLLSIGGFGFGLTPDLGPRDSELALVGMFMLTRFTQGLGGALVQTVIMSILADTFPEAQGEVRAL